MAKRRGEEGKRAPRLRPQIQKRKLRNDGRGEGAGNGATGQQIMVELLTDQPQRVLERQEPAPLFAVRRLGGPMPTHAMFVSVVIRPTTAGPSLKSVLLPLTADAGRAFSA